MPNVIRNFIEKKTVCVLKKANCEVRACRVLDTTSKEMTAEVCIYYDSGISKRIALKRSQSESKNQFNFLLDMEGDFQMQDIQQIRATLWKRYDDLPIVDMESKTPLENVYDELCHYASEHLGEDSITFTEGYYNINSKEFTSIIKNMECEYTRSELLKEFKLLGLIRTKYRTYTYPMSDNKKRAVSIKAIQEEK